MHILTNTKSEIDKKKEGDYMICPYCSQDIKFIDNMECCSGDEVECDNCNIISKIDYDELPTDTDWGNVGFYYLIRKEEC